MNPNPPQQVPSDQPQPPSYQDPYTAAQPLNMAQPTAPSQYPQNSYEQDPYLTQQPVAAQSSNIFVSQPSPKHKKPVALIISGIALLVVLILGGVGFYGWQAGWFGAQQTQQATPAALTPAEATFDTPALVETEINDMQDSLDKIDDSQLADDTISDTTLGQ